ncbi:MAG: hydrolase [Gammaproteobacteria bacterium]|nr:hydrolase [Gammaproteobacteria bacterium]NVK89492.1 hydrolase [Gammaproteobacteria bacterium]
MASISASTFKPTFGLSNRHLQTLVGPLLAGVRYHPQHWQELVLSDGDFVELAWFGAPADKVLLLLHGLEGSYQSHYAQRLIHCYTQSGWQVVVAHFRSCGRRLNRSARSYHSGSSDDLAEVITHLPSQASQSLYAIGFSLGGNVLLKWLGENPKQTMLSRAMAVSVPLRLDVCASAIDNGFSRFYQQHLIGLLKKKMHAKRKLGLLPMSEQSLAKLAAVKNFWQFDQQVTAPLNGFASADDYYQRASSISFLTHIATPTLILQALDDPFMNHNVLPAEDELSPNVQLELSKTGGHVGFVESYRLYQRCFLARRSLAFFNATDVSQAVDKPADSFHTDLSKDNF